MFKVWPSLVPTPSIFRRKLSRRLFLPWSLHKVASCLLTRKNCTWTTRTSFLLWETGMSRRKHGFGCKDILTGDKLVAHQSRNITCIDLCISCQNNWSCHCWQQISSGILFHWGGWNQWGGVRHLTWGCSFWFLSLWFLGHLACFLVDFLSLLVSDGLLDSKDVLSSLLLEDWQSLSLLSDVLAGFSSLSTFNNLQQSSKFVFWSFANPWNFSPHLFDRSLCAKGSYQAVLSCNDPWECVPQQLDQHFWHNPQEMELALVSNQLLVVLT